jgi:demethylmenaquinone methyltransferase/2-methoxy-6-polyprenyl-1,4-benzoquinol methylase
MSRKIGPNPNIFATELFDGLPNRYDRLGWLLSLGQDRRWRAALVEKVNARAGDLVLDVATGTGGVALALRDATGADVVGIDLTGRMLERAREKLDKRGEDGIRLVQGRAESLPFANDSFDSVSYTYLLRYVNDPTATLAELARVLRPGGVMSSLEFYVPPSPFWHLMWWCYTRAVLPIFGWLTGGREWFEVGRFLGPNISRHYRQYPLSWTTGAWRAAGMTNVQFRVMSVGGGVVIWGTKTGDG